MTNFPLGRRRPKTFAHVENHPLTAGHLDALAAPVPVQLGVNWYNEFDHPTQDSNGDWWIAKNGRLTSVRGGHAPCLEPGGAGDTEDWWKFYDQGTEGACVGFGAARQMTILNRELYDPWWIWDMAKVVDGDSSTNPGDDNGTYVHAACDVLRTKGAVPWSSSYTGRTWQERDKEVPVSDDGIVSNVWATSAAQVAKALQNPEGDKRNAVVLLNSWGTSYPHRVYLPLTVLDRLISEDGEASVVLDKVVAPVPPTPPTPVQPLQRVSYPRAGRTRFGFVDHSLQLANGVTRTTIMEDGGAVYHIDATTIKAV